MSEHSDALDVMEDMMDLSSTERLDAIHDAKVREAVVALARAVKENQGVMVVGLFGAFTDGQRPVVYGNATGRLALFVSEAFHLACEAIIRRS